jgi:hypothetical protein
VLRLPSGMRCRQRSGQLASESTKRLNTTCNSALINKQRVQTMATAGDMTLRSAEPCLSRFALSAKAKSRVSPRVVKTARRSAGCIDARGRRHLPWPVGSGQSGPKNLSNWLYLDEIRR